MIRLLEKILGEKIAGAFYKISAGSLIAQLIVLASYPLITRFFSPEIFGVRAIFMGILGIALSVSTFAYELAIPIPKKDKTALEVFVGGLSSSLIFAIIVLLLVWLLPELVYAHFSIEPFYPYRYLLPLAILVGSVQKFSFHWSIRKDYHSSVAQSRISYSGIKTLTELTGFWWSASPLPLLLSWINGMFLAAFVYLRKVYVDAIEYWREISFSGIKATLGAYYRFPLYSVLAGLFYYLIMHLPVFFINAFFGLKWAGYFNIAYVPVAILSTILVDAYSQLFQAGIARHLNDSRENRRRMFLKWLKIGIRLGIISTAVLLVFSPSIPYIFGSEWKYSAGILMAISPLLPGFFLFAISFHTFNTLNRQRLLLGFNLFKLLVIILVFVSSKHYSWDIITVLLTFSCLLLLVNCVQTFSAFRVLIKSNHN